MIFLLLETRLLLKRAFLVNLTTLGIVEYNDHDGRYLYVKTKYISDIIQWDENISRHIEFENEFRILMFAANINKLYKKIIKSDLDLKLCEIKET